MFGKLPQPIQVRLLKQLFGVFLISLVTIICIAVFRAWEYSIGFLLAGYIDWIGINLLQRLMQGKIVCKPMVCIKAKKTLLNKDKIMVVLREQEAEPGDEKAIHKYCLSALDKTAALISEHTILNVYYDIDDPENLVAWILTGEEAQENK